GGVLGEGRRAGHPAAAVAGGAGGGFEGMGELEGGRHGLLPWLTRGGDGGPSGAGRFNLTEQALSDHRCRGSSAPGGAADAGSSPGRPRLCHAILTPRMLAAHKVSKDNAASARSGPANARSARSRNGSRWPGSREPNVAAERDQERVRGGR